MILPIIFKDKPKRKILKNKTLKILLIKYPKKIQMLIPEMHKKRPHKNYKMLMM